MERPLRILLLENDPIDEELISHALADAGLAFELKRVANRDSFMAAVSGDVDAVLADLHMPGFGGMEALHVARTSNANIPVILISGIDGEQLAVLATENNAAGSISKDHLEQLGPAVVNAINRGGIRRQ